MWCGCGCVAGVGAGEKACGGICGYGDASRTGFAAIPPARDGSVAYVFSRSTWRERAFALRYMPGGMTMDRRVGSRSIVGRWLTSAYVK